LLPSVWIVEQGFLLFVNRVPRIFAKKYYRARDHVLGAFTKYFADEKNKEGSAPMMWERGAELRSKGISTKDIAAYSYASYAVSAFCSVHLIPELICRSRRTFSKFLGFSFFFETLC
jgi:hypothetical protein